MSKENITIELVTNDFNELSQKVIDLKNKIENEINKVNELYENIKNDITKSYIKKHEILINEENELKDNLNNEITKIKEKLEINLSESKNNIKINERIDKGIKKMANEDKNMIKLISYISKINKNKKLFNELMTNIKIKYEEDKIKYEEYYFNGIPKPKNIEFKDITSSSLNIFWNIDNINNNNNNEEIKYRIEMRKENEEFKKIYEGNNNNYLINNLMNDTNYEFIIYSFYNNLIESKSEIYKIKTLIDSNILKECKRENEFISKLYEWVGCKRMELIFRGTRDGMTSSVFHNKCDNKGETITLINNEKENIFGGYASISWTNDDNFYYIAPESFLFTLSNIYNTEPTKFPNKNDQKEVYHYSGYGPVFGGGLDLCVNGDILNSGGWSNFPHTYQDVLGKGKSIFTGDSNNNSFSFKIKEIEVFKIFK